MLLLNLSAELIERIIDELCDDKGALHACTVTSSAFLTRSQYHLFRSRPQRTEDAPRIDILIGLLHKRESLAYHITALEVLCESARPLDVLRSLPYLRFLGLHGLIEPDSDTNVIARFDWANLPELEHLYLCQCRMSFETLAAFISSLQSLRSLDLCDTVWPKHSIKVSRHRPQFSIPLNSLKMTFQRVAYSDLQEFDLTPLRTLLQSLNNMHVEVSDLLRADPENLGGLQSFFNGVYASLKELTLVGFDTEGLDLSDFSNLQNVTFEELWAGYPSLARADPYGGTQFIPLLEQLRGGSGALASATWNLRLPVVESFRMVDWARMCDAIDIIRKGTEEEFGVVIRLQEHADNRVVEVEEFVRRALDEQRVEGVDVVKYK